MNTSDKSYRQIGESAEEISSEYDDTDVTITGCTEYIGNDYRVVLTVWDTSDGRHWGADCNDKGELAESYIGRDIDYDGAMGWICDGKELNWI